jgi:hypothetical protein
VPSQATSGPDYLADIRSSTCPDFQRCQQTCKHAEMLARLDELTELLAVVAD